MNKDFDIVVEKKISEESSTDVNFVSIGWGSYATQFKGSDGKKTTTTKVKHNFSFYNSLIIKTIFFEINNVRVKMNFLPGTIKKPI